MTKTETKFSVARIENDFSISDLDNESWQAHSQVDVSQNWDGSEADEGRSFTAGTLWSNEAFYVRFDAHQSEPLVISDKPVLDSKTMNLWERDVCEIFIAPDLNQPRRYFEFEVAPTGEWIDLAVDSTSGERITDWKYHSRMIAAARIEADSVILAMKIPWTAFGQKPKSGDIWLGNIFRCVGREPGRGYLAWRPTQTTKPNFHLPEKFGEFCF
jgi:hypothetical protein